MRCGPTRSRNISSGRSGRDGSSSDATRRRIRTISLRSSARPPASAARWSPRSSTPCRREPAISNSGHQQIQAQIPMETQEASEHDVVWVINSDDDFGDYLMYRTHSAAARRRHAGASGHRLGQVLHGVGRHAFPERHSAPRQAHARRARLHRLARLSCSGRFRDEIRQDLAAGGEGVHAVGRNSSSRASRARP